MSRGLCEHFQECLCYGSKRHAKPTRVSQHHQRQQQMFALNAVYTTHWKLINLVLLHTTQTVVKSMRYSYDNCTLAISMRPCHKYDHVRLSPLATVSRKTRGVSSFSSLYGGGQEFRMK